MSHPSIEIVSKYSRQARRGAGLFAIALLLGLSPKPARAQTYLQNVGVPTFTTQMPVENGFINAANGNLHLEIPLGSFPQRGGAVDKVALMYDSAIWQPIPGGTWQPTNVPTASGGGTSLGGWRLVTSADRGSISYSSETYGYCAYYDDYLQTEYYSFIWTAPDGTQHSFPITTNQNLNPSPCGGPGVPTGYALASDGTGYYMYIWNYTQAMVYAPDGTIVHVDGSSSVPEDSNGNYYQQGTSITDTLGRTPVTVTVNGSQIYYDVQSSRAGTVRYTVNTTSIPVYTNFGQSGVGEFNDNITVIQSIQLPDGTNYSFTYDSGTSPGNYGLLTSMTTPLGSVPIPVENLKAYSPEKA